MPWSIASTTGSLLMEIAGTRTMTFSGCSSPPHESVAEEHSTSAAILRIMRLTRDLALGLLAPHPSSDDVNAKARTDSGRNESDARRFGNCDRGLLDDCKCGARYARERRDSEPIENAMNHFRYPFPDFS